MIFCIIFLSLSKRKFIVLLVFSLYDLVSILMFLWGSFYVWLVAWGLFFSWGFKERKGIELGR